MEQIYFNMDTSQMKETNNCMNALVYVTKMVSLSDQIRDLRSDIDELEEGFTKQERRKELLKREEEFLSTNNFRMGPSPKIPEYGKKPPKFEELYNVKANQEALSEDQRKELEEDPFKNQESRSSWLVATSIRGEF